MVNHWKKVLCTSLAACALSAACVAGAAEPTDVTDNLAATMAAPGPSENLPMANYIILDTMVTLNGASWTQPVGYSAYRVWVDNTTKQQMTVTVSGGLGESSKTFSIPAGGNKSITENNAGIGKHTISFKVPSGVLSGTVRVRTSNEALI